MSLGLWVWNFRGCGLGDFFWVLESCAAGHQRPLLAGKR